MDVKARVVLRGQPATKPQHFNGTHGAVAESFVGQILLHTVTYPERFPTNSSKVAFSVSFMTDYAATWSQLYLMNIFKIFMSNTTTN
ncbi:uncharacterized protein VP01_7542g1 [Puccinia sorghi]|uniref:Retrotransposon gag domain-containing protein n=1 Tax=Puccinia sorghi TaxID=27349 RepID=A0A0L6UC55_9BASI|nr:uncharacterized protein VP01_7542g1 [Puccinia sorghi]